MCSQTPLVDSHVHLQDEAFAADRDEVLDRARRAGVGVFICNGASADDWPLVAQLARRHRDVTPCFGLHPWYVGGDLDAALARLGGFLDEQPAAVGEIGLDRWIEPRDEDVQARAFRAQLQIARERQLPAMVHCLRAWGWLMEVLAEEAPLPAGLLIHAYGGAADLIGPLRERGAYFSFAGNVLDPRRQRARAALRAVPADRLLIETDAPDLPPPAEYRCRTVQRGDGRPRNEPANLPAILEGVARLRNTTSVALRAQLYENAQRFFGDLLP